MNMKNENKDIWKDLESAGPGFTTPKGYFGALGERFHNFIKDLDAQTEHPDPNHDKVQDFDNAGMLDHMQKDHGFRVPEGYFQNDAAIQGRPVETPVINLKNKNLKVLYLSVAASVLLFFGIRYMTVLTAPEEPLLLQEKEIAGWIEADLVNLSDNEIAEVFGDLDIEDPLAPSEEVYNYLNYMDIENIMLEN